MIRRRDLSLEMTQQAEMLQRRIRLAHEIGASVLNITDDIYETNETMRAYYKRLAKEQPDFYIGVSKLEGRLNSILIDGCPNSREEI